MRLILAVLLASSCGGPVAQGDLRPAGRPSFPATDRDPAPYTPPPTDTALAGDTVALSAAGGEDQARQMLPALVRALRDADERALEQLLSEDVGEVDARSATRGGRPRASLVERMLLYARRSIIASDAPIEELVDLNEIRVTRASRFFQGRELPSGVRLTDLVVEAPVLEPGRTPLRTLLGWTGRGHLVVRSGRDARIVAF